MASPATDLVGDDLMSEMLDQNQWKKAKSLKKLWKDANTDRCYRDCGGDKQKTADCYFACLWRKCRLVPPHSLAVI
ncbi:hypothetical protein K1719_032001 [Acacia pycnantha]|nr:hypothetical protein K1719_032001 [Acacia pycnantha]